MKVLTTMNLLRAKAGFCRDRIAALAYRLGGNWGDDTPIPILNILWSLSLKDALWALRAVLPEQEDERDRVVRFLLSDFVERVLPLYEREHIGDGRPRKAVNMARRFAASRATGAELARSRAAAIAAWDENGDPEARAAAWVCDENPARAAGAVQCETVSAAGAAADAEAWDPEAAEAAEDARAEGKDAWDAQEGAFQARLGAEATERAWQTERLRAVLDGGEL